MHPLEKLWNKPKRLAIGLMSGTSADGIDAALVRIGGWGLDTKVEQIGFVSRPFTAQVRERILRLAEGECGGSHELCLMNFLLGQLSADACEEVCAQAGVSIHEIDFVGSHGQTLFHIPLAQEYLGFCVNGTLQIGEAAIIAQRIGCPTISDFRVRDMAAGGYGAPLVPYTEFLLYRSTEKNIALQNIGGIGNITFLPKGCSMDQVLAFDTGPGNMVMDALAVRLTQGQCTYDDGGRLAAVGRVDGHLLEKMMRDAYLNEQPPKTTGRERYGANYVDWLLKQAEELEVSLQDTLSTATRFTAECIRCGVEAFCHPCPDRLIVGGGGSLNPTLMAHIRDCLPGCEVLVNEDMGLDSSAKEAVAFAILANEALFAVCNNAPSATGAFQPVVMGKLSL